MPLTFVDPACLTAAILGAAGIAAFARVQARVPTGATFVCTPRPTRLPRVHLVVPGHAALWLLGLALWLAPGLAEEARFFAMIVLLGVVASIAPTAWLFARALAGGVPLQIVGDAHTGRTLVLGERRVALAPASIRAWTVGNGLHGPAYLQLACGPDAATGVALYVAPSLRQWRLAEGASWLPAPTGVCPVARGPELLELLAPCIVPGDDALRPRA